MHGTHNIFTITVITLDSLSDSFESLGRLASSDDHLSWNGRGNACPLTLEQFISFNVSDLCSMYS